MKVSVKSRLFLSYLLILSLALSFTGIFFYQWMTGIVKENAIKSYQSVLVSVIDSIDKEFKRLDDFTLGLGETIWVKRILNMHGNTIDLNRVSWSSIKDYHQQLEIYKLNNEFINEVGIYFHEKDLVMSSLGLRNAKTFFEYVFVTDQLNTNKWTEITKQYNRGKLLTNITLQVPP